MFENPIVRHYFNFSGHVIINMYYMHISDTCIPYLNMKKGLFTTPNINLSAIIVKYSIQDLDTKHLSMAIIMTRSTRAEQE